VKPHRQKAKTLSIANIENTAFWLLVGFLRKMLRISQNPKKPHPDAPNSIFFMVFLCNDTE
jgi:hypothetical protein